MKQNANEWAAIGKTGIPLLDNGNFKVWRMRKKSGIH